MNKKLYIIQDGKLFPQRYNSTQSLNLDIIKKIFENEGYEVIITMFSDVVNQNIEIKNSYIYYASSQIHERKLYIDDVLTCLNRHEDNNILLPNYDLFRCHENKGYQELYKKLKGINSLKGNYHIDFQNEKQENEDVVLKLVDGFGSINVFLVKGITDFRKKYFKNIKKKNFLLKCKHIAKKILKKNQTQGSQYLYEQQTTRRYVIQPLVKNLKFDYKVLVFSNKVYVLKRYIKKNDFRASGSGLWEFPNPNEVKLDIIQFAYQCYQKLDAPFISLDICCDRNKCYLIEFQGLHFGPVTMLNSKGYFDAKNDWKFVEEHANLEREIANSLLEFIEKDE